MTLFMRRNKMTIGAGLLCAALAFAILTVPAKPVEAASNKAKVEKTVRRFWNGARKYNIKKMKKCFVHKPEGVFFTSNKYMRSYCKRRNKAIKYEIVKIKVKKKHAIAVVDVTYPDAYKSIRKACNASVKYAVKHKKATHKGIQRYMVKKIKQYDKKKYPKTTDKKRITIKLVKKKKAWKIKSMTSSMKNMIHCRYNEAVEDYFNE